MRLPSHSKLSFLTSLLLICSALSQNDKKIAGPYEMIVSMVEPCEDVGNGEITLSMKPRNLNRNRRVFSSNFTLKRNFDDDLTVSVNVGQFTNGGIKKNFFKRDFPRACTSLTQFLPKAMKGLFNGVQPTSPNKCSYPPGHYSSNNVTMDETLGPTPIFFYNKYKCELVFSRRGKRVACHYFYSEFVPKNSKRRH